LISETPARISLPPMRAGLQPSNFATGHEEFYVAIDLTGGLPVEWEYVFAKRPAPEVRDACNVWLEEENGAFAMRIGIEAVAEDWDNLACSSGPCSYMLSAHELDDESDGAAEPADDPAAAYSGKPQLPPDLIENTGKRQEEPLCS